MTSHNQANLNRRTFLQVTGALGVALALEQNPTRFLVPTAEAAPAHATDEKIVTTFCQMCRAGNTCAIRAFVKDGKWTRVEPNPAAAAANRGTMCAKSNAAMQMVYSPLRLQYPMKRAGEKGEGKFTRITWDEALDTIASKLKEAKDKYGPESFALLSPENYFPVATLGRRFLNLYGSPNYAHSAICSAQRSTAAAISIGREFRTSDDYTKSKLILVWGANPENASVAQGGALDILDAKAKGAKLIAIKPMMDALVTHADIWLPIRPGTDGALALAMLNVIIGDKLYDADFVANWTSGFDKLAEHIKQFTPEWAAEKTGLAADKIKEVAWLYATTKPATIRAGNAFDVFTDTTDACIAYNLLTAITGNIDVPGGNTTVPGVINTKNITLADKATPAMVQKLVAPEFPTWYQKAGSTTSAYYPTIMSALSGKPYPIRVLCAQATNPLSATRNPVGVAEALKKTDFFIAMDCTKAPHVDYADIVLPACTGYERDDDFGIVTKADSAWIGIRNKVVEPIGESRSDSQFWLDLAVKMGMGKDFWDGSMEACLNEQLSTAKITVADLRKNPDGIVVKRTAAIQYKQYAQIFQALPGGKVQCFNQVIDGKANAQETGKLSGLPVYIGPPEGLAETPDIAKDYPLILSDVHAERLSNHSWQMDIPYLRELSPYPWVRINPATAKKYEIKDGDWVVVESKFGNAKYTAVFFEGLPPEILMTKRGWWQSVDELKLPGYGVFNGGSEVNVLYNPDPKRFDGMTNAMSKQTLVRIKKA